MHCKYHAKNRWGHINGLFIFPVKFPRFTDSKIASMRTLIRENRNSTMHSYFKANYCKGSRYSLQVNIVNFWIRSQSLELNRGGGVVPTQEVGATTYYFCQKLLENERNWTGGRIPRAFLDQPIPVERLKLNITLKTKKNSKVSVRK